MFNTMRLDTLTWSHSPQGVNRGALCDFLWFDRFTSSCTAGTERAVYSRLCIKQIDVDELLIDRLTG